MSETPLQLGPIHLQGSLHSTIWGGRNLAVVAGKTLPDGATIGESWETAAESIAINASFAGHTLGDLVSRFGEDLIGVYASRLYGRRFPLLAKFLDAQQWLSVQVHPNDEYARRHEQGKLGKTEAWYILHADPGAQLIYGLTRRATRAEVHQAIADGHLEDLLYSIEAQTGDIIFVPAGTIHAIGSGIVLYELQEYSDVTYRLYDYGRLQANGQPRELHVEHSLNVMQYAPPERVQVITVDVSKNHEHAARRVLVACEYFVEEEVLLAGELASPLAPGSCEILTVLEGDCTLDDAGGELHLRRGDTVVLPATLKEYRVAGDGARLVRSYVPAPDDPKIRIWQEHQSQPDSR